MPITDAVGKVKEVTQDELLASFSALYRVAAWGAPGAEASNNIDTTLQVNDINGTAVTSAQYLIITCDTGVLSLVPAGDGTVLKGSGTKRMIIETGATGAFDLRAFNPGAGTTNIAVGPTQGSAYIDCKVELQLTFA